MFDKIGSKLKGIAAIITWIGIVISFIYGVSFMAFGRDEEFLMGFLIITLGSLVSWLSSVALYGFGQLIENSEEMKKSLKDIHYNTRLIREGIENEDEEPREKTEKQAEKETEEEKYFSCPKCNTLVKFGDDICSNCNAAFDWNKN